MDKKKVKELIDKTIRFTKATDDEYIQGNVKSHIINSLQAALDEFSKSDWVSVEDGLPEYEQEVIVCNKYEPDDILISRRTKDVWLGLDRNDFIEPLNKYPITHWKPIEKLEE